MYKLNGFTLIDTADGKRISYTLRELDDSGNIIKNNIRKSFPVQLTEIDILNSISLLETYILSKQEV